MKTGGEIMKKGRQYEKHGESDPLSFLSETKMLPHLAGIMIVKNGEIPADIPADTEFYDLLLLPSFALCACYLGYANFKIVGEDNADIPVALIWDLFNFTSGLTMGSQIMDRHLLILDKAFELLGFHADLVVRDQDIVVVGGISPIRVTKFDTTNYVGFEEKGINPDVFSQMLARALRRCF